MRLGIYAASGLRWLLLAVLFLAVFAVAGTLIPRPLFLPEKAGEPSVEIFVVANPIHTDIVIPFDAATRTEFAFLQSGNGINWFENQNVRYISFGRGGRAFYTQTPTWADLKAIPLLKGITIDSAVIHVEPLGEIFRDNPVVTPVRITPAALVLLRKEIHASFTGADPMPIAGKSYGEFDDFYEADGYFNALFGCNTWTARILRIAGVRTGIWNPLPQSLRLSLKLYN